MKSPLDFIQCEKVVFNPIIYKCIHIQVYILYFMPFYIPLITGWNTAIPWYLPTVKSNINPPTLKKYRNVQQNLISIHLHWKNIEMYSKI
jgi:hypothetical protein